jgi:predicted lipid-binding transport protein (Tim44 family)
MLLFKQVLTEYACTSGPFLQEIRMKKLLSMLVIVFTLGISTVAMQAEAAKRMGAGKSLGTQRQATVDKAPATPAQAPTAAAAAGAGAAAAPARSWMGPVAGLAAGLGLAALASSMGFGEELASMVMIGLLAAGIMLAVGFFMRKRAAGQRPSGARADGMQYAPMGAGATTAAPAYKVAMPGSGESVIGSAIGASHTSRIPADFDVAAFERNAKVNFIRLQAANDAGNLDDIRQFTTPEMFAELKMELAERGVSTQINDVVSIQTEVLEVEEGVERYLVSVRFTGVMRDGSGEPDEVFDEIWHLVKPRQGGSGWVLSGIQQIS